MLLAKRGKLEPAPGRLGSALRQTNPMFNKLTSRSNVGLEI